MPSEKIAVIGAGITGLTAARQLQTLGKDVEVFEKNAEPGGSVRSVQQDGWLTEYGPNTLLLKDAVVRDFIRDIGLEKGRIIANESASKRFIVRNGKLEALPASLKEAIKTFVVIASLRDAGRASSLPFRTINRLDALSLAIIRPFSSPISLIKSLTTASLRRRVFGPYSVSQPFCCTVRTEPPGSAFFSKTSTSLPSVCNCRAAVRPVIPAPITAIFSEGIKSFLLINFC